MFCDSVKRAQTCNKQAVDWHAVVKCSAHKSRDRARTLYHLPLNSFVCGPATLEDVALCLRNTGAFNHCFRRQIWVASSDVMKLRRHHPVAQTVAAAAAVDRFSLPLGKLMTEYDRFYAAGQVASATNDNTNKISCYTTAINISAFHYRQTFYWDKHEKHYSPWQSVMPDNIASLVPRTNKTNLEQITKKSETIFDREERVCRSSADATDCRLRAMSA